MTHFSFFRQMTLALAVIASCTAASAQDTPAASKPSVASAKAGAVLVSATGEIVEVDQQARIVVIKGPQGNVGAYSVDPAVKNFDQVKVGDRVRLDYKVGIALALRKGGDSIREKVEKESAAVAAPGSKPGAAATKTTTLVANVVSVNRAKKFATLKGPEGRVADVAIQDPQVLKDIKAGDQVVAVVTASVAVSVKPAPAAK